MKIGYIARYDLVKNPHLRERFKFIEAEATRTISSRGDKVRSKILLTPRKCKKWVDWANKAKPYEYDPFAETE